MTDKTKAKIEAMEDELGPLSSIEGAMFEAGATPWAEWCERFVEHLETCDNDADKEWMVLHNEKMVEEYRQWLEEK